MWPALAFAPQDDQQPSPHWMQLIHSAWERGGEGGLGVDPEGIYWVRDAEIRPGFPDGESESSLKDGSFPQQSGGSGSLASLRVLCCPWVSPQTASPGSMGCSPLGVFWWFWFIASLTSPWTIQHKWCVPVPWDTKHTGNSSFSVTWGFVSILNM